MLKELKPTDCNEAKEHKSPKNSCEVKPSCPEKNKTLSSGEKRIEKYIYSMHALLGKGSFASVFLGRKVSDDTPAAVKVIDRKIFASQYHLKSIHSEIEIMKKMEHPNIVRLLDVYQTSNNLYLVTEYCEEGDLRTHIKKNRKLAEKDALLFLKDIVSGFAYLTKQGVIHRDLKPANILLSKGRCKISDFGFAKNLDNGENTIMQSIVGTPLYMSPQLLSQLPYTNKSDLWSVGLIYYELLHGYTPWPASNELMLINSIANKPVNFDQSISERSKDFIRECLRKKEEDRMSWEEAFTHPLINELSLPRRSPRCLEKRYQDKDNQQDKSKCHSRSKSTKKQTNLNRTPRNIKYSSITPRKRTPEHRSPWKG